MIKIALKELYLDKKITNIRWHKLPITQNYTNATFAHWVYSIEDEVYMEFTDEFKQAFEEARTIQVLTDA